MLTELFYVIDGYVSNISYVNLLLRYVRASRRGVSACV